MTVQEQIDQIAAEAKAKIDELVKLQKQDEPQPGDWCVFWDNHLESVLFFNNGVIRRYKEKSNNQHRSEQGAKWDNCRRITPEDFGWKLENRPDWKDAPNWANYLAQDKDGSWWWYGNNPISVEDKWYLGGKKEKASVEGDNPRIMDKPIQTAPDNRVPVPFARKIVATLIERNWQQTLQSRKK
jgi:hypothetical protein